MCTNFLTVERSKLEPVTGLTKVSRVEARPLSARIQDTILSGTLVDASRYGYDYNHDDKLPERFNHCNVREMDFAERRELLSYVQQRVKDLRSEYNIKLEATNSRPPQEPVVDSKIETEDVKD